MKIKLLGGEIIHLPFPSGCTGYVAESIEIDAEDVFRMHELLHTDPEQLCAALNQLEYRFQSARRKLQTTH